jgi:hypothetical protein
VIQGLDTFIRSIAWGATPDINYFVTVSDDRSVRMWKFVEEGSVCQARVHWRPVNGQLNVIETSIQDMQELSRLNGRLLKQRGAVGTPLLADRLRAQYGIGGICPQGTIHRNDAGIHIR